MRMGTLHMYITSRTVMYWLMNRNPIVEFKFIGNNYVRTELEDGYQVVFNFVRDDGNRRGYMNRDHYRVIADN